MNEFNIRSAQNITDEELNVLTIKATIDGVEMFVPLDPANRHYAAIMEQVDSGTLTIAEADNG
jgi:hypothetical protein